MEFIQMMNKNNPRVKKWIYKAKLRAFNRMKGRMKNDRNKSRIGNF